jgi:hypothetical protein
LRGPQAERERAPAHIRRRAALRGFAALLGVGVPALAACQPRGPVAASAATPSSSATLPATSWAIGGNVGVFDWAPSPFVDVVCSSRGFGKPDEWAENLEMARDAQGWPAEPSRIVITAVADRPGTEWQTGVWKGRWRGSGNLTASPVSGGTIGNVVRKGDVVTFDWTVHGAPFLSLAFDGPIRDLRLVRPGFDLDNHPLLHPDARDYYKQFHTLRFHDFMGQNDTEDQGEATWSRRQPAGKFHGRKSWEAMAAFFEACFDAPGSRTRGIWWNVPYRFGEEDCLALGKAMKALLPAHALKFSELSNELWNSGYGGKWKYFQGRANDTRHPDYALVNEPAGTEWQRLARLWALQSARMARAMKEAFPGEFARTLFPVTAGQLHGIHWHRDEILPWLSRKPQVSAFGGLPNTYFGSLAAAPYLSGTQDQLDRAADVDAMVRGLEKGFDTSLERTRVVLREWAQLRRLHGIARLDAYEWQLHTHGNANAKVKLDVNADPAAGRLVKALAYAMRDAGFGAACFLSVTPIAPVVDDVNSFLWPLNASFAGPRSAKGRAVAELIAETKP